MPLPSPRRLPGLVLRATALFVALAAGAHAQTAVLTGRVTDETGAPLPGAHVYLAGTLQGTTTNAAGHYRLPGVPLGTHRLVASMLGYAPGAQALALREAGEHAASFRLAEAVRELGEVAVTGRRDRRWQRQRERFERTLLGASTFARETAILNPEVLTFSERFGTLRAEAAAPLVVENRALGYRLHYTLRVFEAGAVRVRYDGEEFFEALAPEGEAEAARWAANRATAYAGSLRHFLRALLAGTTEAEGFTVTHRPWTAAGAGAYAGPDTFGISDPRRRFVRPARHAGESRLGFSGHLAITFRGPEDPGFLTWEWNRERAARPDVVQRSEVTLARGPVTLDASGEPSDPFGIVTMGYLAFRRLALRLPAEYGRE